MEQYINKNLAISELLDCKLAGSSGMIFASEALKKLNDVPAEDVEPVRHGKWINAFINGIYHYRCSECGEYTEGIWHANFDYKYCPNCGAKMDFED